jgi:tetratricopeptide (TPR) repeat protein
MKNTIICCLASTIAVACLVLPQSGFATCGGGGGGGVGGMGNAEAYYVPWRHTRTKDDLTTKDSLILYWIPVSATEFQKSPLRYSRTLTLYAGQCIAMCVIDSADSPIAKEYAAGATQPVAALVTADGSLIAKTEGSGGQLAARQVEDLVGAEYKKREAVINQKIDAAAIKAKTGDSEGAIADYRSVLEQSCLFPKRAREASRRLKKMGVGGVGSVPDAPNFDPIIGSRMAGDLKQAIADEMHDKYLPAQKLYESAHRLDPADPTPLRYLGELYRHEFGDWDKAARIFDEILALHADPLSRAVALHGLGKMTIHNGQFKKGEALMEQSAAVYPLAMTYRNLAVYWNSEGNPTKAAEYTQEALKQDPTDPFNLVFAATFMAANGRSEEALKIARENESLLPASYNLAAIYAQAGQKQKALALLKRHFFEYERYENVRSKEMMEARVDKLFEPIVKDKEFLALTSGADGRLPMRTMQNAEQNTMSNPNKTSDGARN